MKVIKDGNPISGRFEEHNNTGPHQSYRYAA
jgi:hypothetical protein